ncbi:MAG: hypothetical protein V1827_03485 [Candidatus Micrarchaeota archaeon]
MDSRFVLLMLVACSLLLLGCAGKKANADKEDGTASAGGGSGDADRELADLFNVSMEKPVEGEGLDSKTPASD